MAHFRIFRTLFAPVLDRIENARTSYKLLNSARKIAQIRQKIVSLHSCARPKPANSVTNRQIINRLAVGARAEYNGADEYNDTYTNQQLLT